MWIHVHLGHFLIPFGPYMNVPFMLNSTTFIHLNSITYNGEDDDTEKADMIFPHVAADT